MVCFAGRYESSLHIFGCPVAALMTVSGDRRRIMFVLVCIPEFTPEENKN